MFVIRFTTPPPASKVEEEDATATGEQVEEAGKLAVNMLVTELQLLEIVVDCFVFLFKYFWPVWVTVHYSFIQHLSYFICHMFLHDNNLQLHFPVTVLDAGSEQTSKKRFRFRVRKSRHDAARTVRLE